MMQTTSRPPGRPRSPQADQAILRATLELLVEVGYRSLSMELVRARAGVGKATIYRRHASKDELVKAAMGHLSHEVPVPPDSGSLIDDLRALTDGHDAGVAGGGPAAVMPRLLAEVAHDPELRRIFHEHLVHPRRRQLHALLERAVARGEIAAGVDLEALLDLLIGAMVYRALLSAGEEGREERFLAAVELAIAAVAP